MSYSAFNRNVLSDKFSQEDRSGGKKTGTIKACVGKSWKWLNADLRHSPRQQEKQALVAGRRNGFISVIEREGMRRWFTATGGSPQTIEPTPGS
jgi:hypothetical protein